MSHSTRIRTALLRATRLRWLLPAVALLGLSTGVTIVLSHTGRQKETIDFIAPRLREAAEYTREAKVRRAKPHARIKRLQSPPIIWSEVTLFPSPKEWRDCAVLQAMRGMSPQQQSQVQLVRAGATSAVVAALASEVEARQARIHFGENAALNAWEMGEVFAHWHALAAEHILENRDDEAEAVLRNALVIGGSVFANARDRRDSMVAALNVVPVGRALAAVRATHSLEGPAEGATVERSNQRASGSSGQAAERFLAQCRRSSSDAHESPVLPTPN
jgi:hypothetical protein